MNLAHVHLILNHIPVVGIPLGLVFLVFGFVKKDIASQRFSLFILSCVAIFAIPIYLTGEPAENIVEHLPGVAESFIESHENAAMYSLVLALVTGSLSFLALFFQNNVRQGRMINLCVIFVGLVTVASLAYTANLGGLIRHTELRPPSAATSEAESAKDDAD